eukprot:4577263-Pyramimonas_sp.AAC.1
MSTHRTQPYGMADDKMWAWRRVWTCHETQRMQLPSARVEWPGLQRITVQSVRDAAQTPTRMHPRLFEDISDV